jgi:D-tyrosyl-tRNA(Tyr) deacylase
MQIFAMLAGRVITSMMAGRQAAGIDALISLIQRVSEASVTVDSRITGQIGRGILALLAIQPDDGPPTIARMVERVLTYRVFPDSEGRMNRSLEDEGLELLVVPQFTLAADTKKGTRASFTRAAPPEKANEYFELFVKACKERQVGVETGVFGADMKVSLVNDGPVTFWLEA